ncbi:hypothetical protein ABQG29_02405 [Xanthomonas nasturtii]
MTRIAPTYLRDPNSATGSVGCPSFAFYTLSNVSNSHALDAR